MKEIHELEMPLIVSHMCCHNFKMHLIWNWSPLKILGYVLHAKVQILLKFAQWFV